MSYATVIVILALVATLALWLAIYAFWRVSVLKHRGLCTRLHLPEIPADLLVSARAAVRSEEADPSGAGNPELRHHRVYARLRKAFPDASPRTVNHAIEAAVIEET